VLGPIVLWVHARAGRPHNAGAECAVRACARTASPHAAGPGCAVRAPVRAMRLWHTYRVHAVTCARVGQGILGSSSSVMNMHCSQHAHQMADSACPKNALKRVPFKRICNLHTDHLLVLLALGPKSCRHLIHPQAPTAPHTKTHSHANTPPRPHPPASCAQGAARNRMLVKGGSAFNGLVRAMKQDLVEGGVGAAATRKDPNALYEVRAPPRVASAPPPFAMHEPAPRVCCTGQRASANSVLRCVCILAGFRGLWVGCRCLVRHSCMQSPAGGYF